jgi:hypothetical protein
MMLWSERRDFKEFRINKAGEFFGVAVWCLLWPISITVVLWAKASESYRDYIVHKGSNIMSKYDMSKINVNDRSGMLTIPEGDLKFLLRHYRKGTLKLEKYVVELIRDELMHRTAERDLLK